jgi:hypothetical protein
LLVSVDIDVDHVPVSGGLRRGDLGLLRPP